jgi:hypothetical protein
MSQLDIFENLEPLESLEQFGSISLTIDFVEQSDELCPPSLSTQLDHSTHLSYLNQSIGPDQIDYAALLMPALSSSVKASPVDLTEEPVVAPTNEEAYACYKCNGFLFGIVINTTCVLKKKFRQMKDISKMSKKAARAEIRRFEKDPRDIQLSKKPKSQDKSQDKPPKGERYSKSRNWAIGEPRTMNRIIYIKYDEKTKTIESLLADVNQRVNDLVMMPHYLNITKFFEHLHLTSVHPYRDVEMMQIDFKLGLFRRWVDPDVVLLPIVSMRYDLATDIAEPGCSRYAMTELLPDSNPRRTLEQMIPEIVGHMDTLVKVKVALDKEKRIKQSMIQAQKVVIQYRMTK